jgi:tetratricopeptide (TPR) repeat protein
VLGAVRTDRATAIHGKRGDEMDDAMADDGQVMTEQSSGTALNLQDAWWRVANDAAVGATQRGDYAAAEQGFAEAIKLAEAARGRLHGNAVRSAVNLAHAYALQKKYGLAEPLLEGLLGDLRREGERRGVAGGNGAAVAEVLGGIALSHELRGDYAEAAAARRWAVDTLRDAVGPAAPEVAKATNALANCLANAGDDAAAEPLYRQALAIARAAPAPWNPLKATILSNLAKLCHGRGRHDEAEPLYLEAVAVRRKAFGKTHTLVVESTLALARLYDDQGCHEAAAGQYERAIAAQAYTSGKNSKGVAAILDRYARTLRKAQKVAEADAAAERARRIRGGR